MSLRRPRRVQLVILVTAAVGAGGSSLAVAAMTSDSKGLTPSQAALPPVYRPDVTPGLPKLSSIPGGVASRLGVFRRARADFDTPPDGVITHDLVSRGANPALARLATTVRDQAVYLVPVSDGVCAASSAFLAAGCVSTSDLDANGAVHMESVVCSPYLASDLVEVDGLAADGVAGLTMSYSDGSERSVPVAGNEFVVYAPRTGPYPVSVDWTFDGTSHRTIVPFTADTATVQCGATAPAQAIAQERSAVAAAAPAG
jgi:hypothetical protein